MNETLRTAAIVVVSVTVVVLVVGRCYEDRIDEWEQRVERVQQSHRGTEARLAEELRQEEARADSAEARAEELEAQEPVIRERIDSVRVETPAELEGHPAITTRDSIIDTLIVQRNRWKGLFHEEQEANVRLRGLLEESRADADSLSNVLEDRPSDRPWYLPRLGVGPGIGIEDDGTAYTGVGVHLTWEIKL